MKKAFGKIVSVTLAFIVLFSTFSFTVEKHLCGGKVADYSFIGNVERCVMPNNNTKETFLHKIPCCEDIVETIEGTNTELKIVKELNFQQIQFIAAFVTSYINLFEGLEQSIIPFKEYKPPLVTKDIQVLHDTFLI